MNFKQHINLSIDLLIQIIRAVQNNSKILITIYMYLQSNKRGKTFKQKALPEGISKKGDHNRIMSYRNCSSSLF